MRPIRTLGFTMWAFAALPVQAADPTPATPFAAAAKPAPSNEQKTADHMGDLAAKGDNAGFEALRRQLEAEHTPEAYVALGDLYRDLPTVYILHIKRYEIAAGYYQQALDVSKDTKRGGNITNAARVSLARMMLSGRIRNHDYAQALGLLKKAIESGDNSAPYLYARRMELGYGEEPPNYHEAEYWYRYALRGQVGEAAIALASLYRRHHAKAPNPESEKQMAQLGLTLLQYRADAGDGSAAYRIGYLYATGNGVPLDPAKAREWYERAAKAGSISAYKQLATITSRAGDRAGATAYMEKAAQAGSVSAAAELARSLTQSGGYYLDVEPQVAQAWLVRAATVGHVGSIILYTQKLIVAGKAQQAVSFLENAAMHGSIEAYCDLYQLFKLGTGVTVDISRAKRYMAEALASADMTSAEKIRVAGLLLLPGEPVFDVSTGLDLLHEAAASGNGDAMNALADLTMHSSVVPKNPALSVEWRTKASNAGNLSATLELARLYEEGIYVPRDPKKAYGLVVKVLINVAPDDGKAMLSVGRIYVNGKVVAKDMEEAAKWYRRAVTAGNPEALVALARLVKYGAIRDVNPTDAVAMFRRGAANGSRSALVELAMLYGSGTLVPQDMRIALDYYRLAAQNGSTEAMRQVGLAYLGGFGIDPDLTEGRKFIVQSASMGNVFAMLDLGNIYAREGDRTMAWKYWKLAAQGNDPDALYMMAVATRTGEGQPKDMDASERYLKAAAKLRNYPAKRELRLRAQAAGAAH